MPRIIAFLFIFLFPVLALADSGAGEWVTEREVSARLISPTLTTGNDSLLTVGLEIKMQPGWHTYWRSPGLAGLPATIDTSGSTNLKAATILWPYPERMSSQGMESFAYPDYVVLPLLIDLEDKTKPLALHTKVDLLACSDLCVPFTLTLTLDLPTGDATPSPWKFTFEQWLDRVPVPGYTDFDILHVSVDGNRLLVKVNADPPLQKPELIVESQAGYLFPAAQLVEPGLLVTSLPDGQMQDAPLDKDELTLTLIDGNRAIEKQHIRPGPAVVLQDAPPPTAATSISLLTALLAALVGGLILNLMPCVLPVLSLKLLSIVRHAGAPPAHIRASFLASAAGIIVSFLVLASVAIAFKQAGVAIGWGVQFQHPAFIIPMVLILTLFTASMWNLAEIPLPRFLADAINDRLPAPGEHDQTLVGNFVTGAFATILATPCSAPFVGTALGFALAGTPLDITLVALSMGLGLALPYILIAVFPAIAHHMPRPGRWMNWLKGAFGLALLISALWLANVLTPQIGQQQASLVGGGSLMILLVLWIRRSIKTPIVFVKGAVAIALGLTFIFMYPRSQPTDIPMVWQDFDEAAISRLVGQNKIVFVDVTADWCLTCHANKKFVIEAEPTRSHLTGPDVVLMRADWTTPRDDITAYLKKFGRFGIPFNVVYGPKTPAGVALPELLSAAKVEDALKQAGWQPK